MSTSGGAMRLHLSLALVLAFAPSSPAQDVPVLARDVVTSGIAPETRPPVWNDARVIQVARSAIDARLHAYSDSSLRDFRAEAEGHVYFLSNVQDEEWLIRADQIALWIAWQAPGNATQAIRGKRSQQNLPSEIRYHLDHLAVVLDNFGDRIVIGDGDEVDGVLHPFAPGAERHYQYRLVDSVEVRFPTGRAHLYKLEVRPARLDDPGVVGTAYVDKETWAIARMSFTFTPASYEDPRLASIEIDLTSALWDGLYWLPVEQSLTIRRESSWLSFPVGSEIRAHFVIGDYSINRQPAYAIPDGQRLVSYPPSVVADFDGWSRGLFEGPLDAAENRAVSLEEVRKEARDIAGRRLVPSGKVRLWYDGLSNAFRARRAEGVLVGTGAEYSLANGSVAAWAGYPFASEVPEVHVALKQYVGAGNEIRIDGYLNRFTDVGPFQAAAGLVSTISLALDGEDFTDPYFQDGVSVSLSRSILGGRSSVTLAYERQAAATLETSVSGARPVRPVQQGDLARVTVELRPSLGTLAGARLTGRLDGEAGAIDEAYGRWLFGVRADGRQPHSPWGWEARLAGGISVGTLPPQRLILLGGRGTVAGYPFRAWGGGVAALGTVTGTRELLPGWITVRAMAAAGWVDITSAGATAAATFGATQSDGVRPSLGAGIGLFRNVVWVDAARGLDRGEWEWMVSVNRYLWPIL